MKHQEAIDTYAAEGYILDQLTEDERTAFEEHFADCEACFADVKDVLRFATVVPNVVSEPSLWVRFKVPAVAAAAVIATMGVQQVAFIAPLRAQVSNVRAELAKEREPRPAPIYAVGDRRAELATIANGRTPYGLEFMIPPEHPSPLYTYTIADARGKKLFSGQITAEEARDHIDLHMPGGVLPPGDYSLLVTGTGGVSAYQAEFTVR